MRRFAEQTILTLAVVVSLGAAGREAALIDAVKVRDITTVRALLRGPVDANAREVDGTTALHWAVHRDDIEIANVLVRAGANVQVANRYGVTPLSLACVNARTAMIEMLLNAGASPNTALPGGETAVMTAARTGNSAALDLLLDHGADVHAKESWRGQDALMWAAGEGHASAVKVLLENGADVNSPSKAGYTPLLFAARGGHLDVVTILLTAGAGVNDVQAEGVGALILAIHNAHFELAVRLLEKGAEPNIIAAGYAPLHLAVQVRNPDLEGIAEPVPTGDLDSLDLIKALLAHGASPNARMAKPFIRIRRPENLSLVGATPFLLAAKAPDVPVMRLLLAHGADSMAATEANAPPLMVAAGIGYTQGVSPGLGVPEVAAHSPWGGPSQPLEAVRLLLELGAEVNAATESGFTALHGAAIRGDNDVVRLLVQKGAKLDARNKEGQTALTLTEDAYGVKRQPQTAVLLRELGAR